MRFCASITAGADSFSLYSIATRTEQRNEEGRGLRVSGFGFWVLAFGFWVFGFRVEGFGFRVKASRVQGLRFRIQGFFKVQSLGFRALS